MAEVAKRVELILKVLSLSSIFAGQSVLMF